MIDCLMQRRAARGLGQRQHDRPVAWCVCLFEVITQSSLPGSLSVFVGLFVMILIATARGIARV